MKKRLRIVFTCLLFCALLLQTLPHDVQATVDPTARGLTEFALKAWRENWGYVYGTYGQSVSQSLIDGKASQYPDVFSKIMSDGRTAYQNAQEWIGSRAADCVGLIKAYLWWQDDYSGPRFNNTQDKSANSMYFLSEARGPIETLPETHGLLVWRDGHIGIYIGNGEVIEARGVEYGVVKTRLTDRGWTNWCRLPYLAYTADGWTSIDGRAFYYRDGVCLTGLQVIEGKTWLLGSDGSLQTGFQLLDGKIRYFPPDGGLLTGWQTIGGSRYYLDENGCASVGWQTTDGKLRLFGWQGVLLTGWQEMDGAIFCLDDQGVPLTGNQSIDGRQIVFDTGGRLLTGWQVQDGQAAYYGLTGQKASGLQLIDGRTYLFADGGSRSSGWQELDGRKYYLAPDTGAALTGLQSVDKQTWLFQENGILRQAAGLFWNSGRIYLGDADGHPLTGLQTINGYQAGDPAAVPVILQFADDFALIGKNQESFTLDPAELVLSTAPADRSAAPLAASQPVPTGRWLSLDPDVATVSADGLVAAVNPGRTLVVLLDEAGGYAAAQVTVLPDPAALTDAGAALVLEPGRSADLAVAGLPDGLLEAAVLASSDPAIVTVAANGRLLAIKPGTVTISARFGEQAVSLQTVQVQVPLLGLSASRPALVLPVGAAGPSFASPVPTQAGSSLLNFSSSDPAVASVSSKGTIRGLAPGTAVITAQAGSLSIICAIQVGGSYPILRPGSSGFFVRQLQQGLNDLGYPAGTVDGIYGPLTEFAVTAFQQRLQLPLTGQADHALQLALQSDTAPAASHVQVPGALSPGDAGEAVFVLQQRLYDLNDLKVKPDGQYGDLTRQAVATMQTLNGLPLADGVDQAAVSRLFSRTVKAGKTTLLLGDSGYEVLSLQTRLQALKYYPGVLDSQFSLAVDGAVRNFQTQCSLTADGEAGPLTQARLFAADAPVCPQPAAPLPVVPAEDPVLRLGSQGQPVQDLERRLVALGYHYELADQVFDSLTVASVKAFQARAGASQTGIADSQTAARLSAGTAPYSTVTFRIGSRGDNVRRIQLRLKQLGFSCGVIDGIFGSMSASAAKAFQRRVGLSADGIVGRQTLSRLFAGDAPASPQPSPVPAVTPAPAPAPAPIANTIQSPPLATYRIGSRGEGVRLIQLRLNQLGYNCGKADGIFGSMTATAAKAYQRRAGLTVDGIVGRQTLSSLFAVSAPRSS